MANLRLSAGWLSAAGWGGPPGRRLSTTPKNKDLKRLVRARMAGTGENYTQALTHVLGQVDLEPLPPAWHVTGTRASDYEAGLVPEITHEGNRVARLRLRPGLSKPGLAEPASSGTAGPKAAASGTAGFGTLMQSITAIRYLDRRVRFSALLRAWEVLLIGGAPPGQVQRPADQRMPAAAGIGQGDRHLAQRDTAERAAVLPRRADRALWSERDRPV